MCGDFIVCLDACVLFPPALCDVLLRLAEHPRLYRPVFSDDILAEVRRCQMTRFKKPYTEQQADHWRSEVLNAFPDALVTNYQQIIPILGNHEKDRHVLAAAIKGQAQHIVTANLKDFRTEHLQDWDITAIHPQSYLLTLFEHSPERVTDCLRKIARDRSKKGHEVSAEQVLTNLRATVPQFVTEVARDLGWELD